MYNDSLFNAFARSYEARSETDMPMTEYLESCRGDPMRYANAAERLLAAIGEPQMIDTAKDPPPWPYLYEPHHARLPGLRRIPRHGRSHRAHCRVLPACRSGSGRAQANPLSARPGRRRQIVARRAAEVVDGGSSHLRAEGWRRTQPCVRVTAQPVRFGIAGSDDRRKVRHSASPPERTDESLVLQAAGSFRWRYLAIPCRQDPAFAPAPDRDRENRARRREQSGYLLAGRQGRHSQAGDLFAQNDPDAYSYSGGLNRANQGILEFVEMFKAPIKMLHPLLTARASHPRSGASVIRAFSEPFPRSIKLTRPR
jgi:serine protein kinase